MILLILFVLALVSWLFSKIFDNSKRPKNYPPGPRPFKCFGNFPQLLTKGYSK
ncbi:unnamed protein product, partial [Allacma fusca]